MVLGFGLIFHKMCKNLHSLKATNPHPPEVALKETLKMGSFVPGVPASHFSVRSTHRSCLFSLLYSIPLIK